MSVHTCARCDYQSGSFGKWWHTYFGWNWWRAWDVHRSVECRRVVARDQRSEGEPR